MAYANDQKRKYDNAWRQARRLEWIAANGPCAVCHDRENLLVARKTPSKAGLRITEIWSRRQAVRDEELANCEVLCERCYMEKKITAYGPPAHSIDGYRKGCRCDICCAFKRLENAKRERYRKPRGNAAAPL